MAVQEKLGQGFETVQHIGFGEANADNRVKEAVKQVKKDKGPGKLSSEQAKTLLVLDILKTFSTDKGLVGIKTTLDRLEAQFPTSGLGAIDQKSVDVIAEQLERQGKKFQAEIGGTDQDLFKEVGLLVRGSKWTEASALVRRAIVDANTRGDIDSAQNTRLTQSVDDLDSNNISQMRTRIVGLETEQLSRRVPGTGEIATEMERATQLEVRVARRYVEILKGTPQQNDIDPNFSFDSTVVSEPAIDNFIGDLHNRSSRVAIADERRLKRFKQETTGNWSSLSTGIDLESWSRGSDSVHQDRQRVIREASAVASHILFLRDRGEVTLSSEERTYLEALQKATSAVKRSWVEDAIHEGEAMAPTDELTPEEMRELKRQAANMNLLAEIGSGQGFADWARQQRARGPRRGWNLDTESAEDGFSFQEKIMELRDAGMLEIDGGQIVWLKGPDEFFGVVAELARDVSAIVPEVNQIPFSRSPKAMLYQALMESSAHPGGRGDLAWAKDAVFRLYTMGYVKEALWKKGGDVESFSGAALALLGQGEDDSVYSSLFRFHETVKERSSTGEVGGEIIRIDLRDMLDFSEYYSRIKDGKRSWLNAISAGELDSGVHDATSKPQRMEFFYDYMKWVLDRQLDMGEIDAATHTRRMVAVGASAHDKKHENLFDVYGQYYTNLVKVMQSIQLRYGQVAVNQIIDGDGFEFCNPPGGEAPYKYHKKTAWKFDARYVPNNKFAEFLDGKVDLAMVSSIAYARKETVPHFCLENSGPGANPGADKYFFETETNLTNRAKWAKQWVKFWKPAMFDSDDHPGKEYRETDDIRMIEETQEIAKNQLSTMPVTDLEFVSHIDYTKLSEASGYDFDRIFRRKNITDSKEKFKYVIDHYGYKYFEWNGFRSKRVGDFYTKYLPKNYAGVYGAAIKLAMNATNDEAVFEASQNIDAFSGAEKFMEDMDAAIEKINKRTWGGIRKPKTRGGKGWLGVGVRGEHSTIDLNGDFESSLRGLLPGALPRTSLAGYYLRHRDPDWMRPVLWEQAYERGQMKPETFEKRMRDYKGEMYFGSTVRGSGFRWGYIPLLTPFALARGWFVDKMHLDIDDFWWITRKANKDFWEEFKKVMNIKV